MSFYQKLFKREAEKAVKEVESAEQMLQNAEKKITELKTTRKSDLIKKELIQMIDRYANSVSSHDREQRSAYHFHFEGNCHDCNKIKEKRNEILSAINEMVE